jgi:hypothetical protein
VQHDLISSQYHCFWGCKRCCWCKGVVIVGFSSVLSVARKVSGPSQWLLVACVILGTVVAFCGADWGMGSQSAIVWCLPTWFPWAMDLFLQWCCVCEVNLKNYSASQIWHLRKWVWSSTGCWQDWHSLGCNVALYLATIFPVANHPCRNLRRNVGGDLVRLSWRCPYVQELTACLKPRFSKVYYSSAFIMAATKFKFESSKSRIRVVVSILLRIRIRPYFWEPRISSNFVVTGFQLRVTSSPFDELK